MIETYDRGVWGKDETLPDEYKKHEIGFDEDIEFTIGPEYEFHIDVYVAHDPSTSKYSFLVAIGNSNRVWEYLVTDWASLFMLVKEASPMIEDVRKQELFEMQEEEHQWKAKGLEKYQHRKHCGHIVD
jgi:hypothetical protein